MNDKPLILRQIDRILNASLIDRLVVATSRDTSDDPLVKILEHNGILVYRGNLNNVLSRYLELIKLWEPQRVIRLTADCPLIDHTIIDEVISSHIKSGADYTSNTLHPTFPDGLDVECFKSEILLKLDSLNPTTTEIEHVTYGLYSREGFCKLNSVQQEIDLSNLRWTVDTPEDLDFVRIIYGNFSGRESHFGQQDVLDFLKKYPNLSRTDKDLKRNFGMYKGETK